MSSGATAGSAVDGVVQYQGAELVPMGSVGTFNSVQELWAYCTTKLVTALDQVHNLELDDEKPEDVAARVAVVKAGIATMMSSTVWDEKYIDMPPSEFYRLFLGGLTAQHLGVKTLRKLYEHLNNASSQCRYAERYCGVVPTGWDTCYICGLKGDIPGLSSFECEHILPAFTSLGHYGLIESSLQLTAEDIEWYSYEYANSHQCCNQIKTDTKWIVFNPATKQYEINEPNINKTLGDIYSGISYDCPSLTPSFKTISKQAFITNRKGYIIGNYLIKLVEMINRSSSTKGEAYNVLIRVRQINALNITYDQIAAGLVGSRFTPPPTPIQELIYNETQAKEVQLVIETEFNSKIGPIFVETILGRLKILPSVETLAIVQAFLETARLSSRQYENTIRNHAVDEGKLVGKELRNIRDICVKTIMDTITLPIAETQLKEAMVKGVALIKQRIDTFVYNRIISLRPELRERLDTCVVGEYTMTGGGIAYAGAISPLDIEAGPVMMDKSILTLPEGLATITRVGRVSKPTLQLERGLRGEQYVSVRRSLYEEPTKFLIKPFADKRFIAVDTMGNTQFYIDENLGKLTAKNAAGVEYKIQMGGRKKYSRKTKRRVRKSRRR